jgi:hypothetical protein
MSWTSFLDAKINHEVKMIKREGIKIKKGPR